MIEKHQQQLFSWLLEDNQRMQVLKTVETVADEFKLGDCWIAAGFVRNLIWDKLHGYDSNALNDIDVIHFSKGEDTSFDLALQSKLTLIQPYLPWSVKNQSLMHTRNGDAPYISCSHSMTFWPEIETAVAVRLLSGELQINSPFGLESLFLLNLTHNHKRPRTLFNQRCEQKEWLTIYPKLKVLS
ncbi:nucleotidyltransferase family protein [Parashewanella hymeniacidonis]|uniref:nucleotidyltransferase family protein n=1 Tax=Parashewanella hymeniacidonis TaxID=2807618 RepID=UPI001EF5326B|nr:nucleotidyltransferase family protein [Parashewanella hymeniacidonis]